MKTKEELNAIKEEVENVNRKLAELSHEELKAVIGGGEQLDESVKNFMGKFKYPFHGNWDESE